MDTYGRKEIEQWIRTLGESAKEGEVFLKALAEALLEEPEAAQEFAYYMETGDFLCKMKVDGYTVIDVMVWQMDHFKAEMDRGKYEMKDNSSKMILRAFDTLLKMKQQPDRYKMLMQSETGTDYPGKY
jgi:hypothetical protein